MITVVPVTELAAFALPFMQRALRSLQLAPPEIDFAAVLAAYELLCAVEDDLPKALGVLSFNNGPLCAVPYVTHFYNEGGLPVKKALMRAGIARMKARGYDKCAAMNGSGGDDRVWERVFRGNGCKYTYIGAAVLLEFGKDEE